LLISNRCDRRVLTIILIAAAGCGASTPGNDGGAREGGIAPAIACPWGKDFPSLVLPMSDVKGVLKGPSRNASTTCTRQNGTGGPDTVFVLPVAARTTVELEVVSAIDTVLAIRTACDDPLTELACNDNPSGGSGAGGSGVGGSGGAINEPPPPFPADAAVPVGGPPAGSGRDAVLRATLNPGTYYVVVDEAEPFGVGGPFTLRVRSSAPVAHASCSAAKVLTDGVRLPAEELDVALEKPPSCSGAESRPALFYTARIPSGQRLTVRAQPTNGDRQWNPVMEILSACGNGGLCRAKDTSTPFGDRQLRYVNNGPVAEDVILAVSASTEVAGATYALSVSIGDPVLNGSCSAARPITDGQVLRNQDLGEGQVNQSGQCVPTGGQSLFYSVTMLPQQQLTVVLSTQVSGDPTFPGKGLLFMALHNGCSGLECRTASMGERLDYTNNGDSTEKLVLEVTNLPGLPAQVFDMMVSMPLPPGAISVTPVDGLVTTESGGQATFEIVLGAPPTGPVMIPLESSAPGEGTVSPAALSFGADNWNRPQTVTVTGVDDSQRDGNRPYKILVKPAVSADPRYRDLDADDVSVINQDNEASITFVGGVPLRTSESGTSVTFSAVLNKKPTADVILPLSSSDPGEGTVSPASLTFTPANWDTPQFVTVTGVDDKEQDGAQAYKVVTGTVVTTDPEYSGLDPDDLAAVNADNEFIFVQAHPVNGDLSCFGGGIGQQIAADEAGTIYVALSCLQTGAAGGSPGRGGSTGSGGSSGGSGSSSGGALPVQDAGMAPVPTPIPPPVPQLSSGMVAVSADGGATFTRLRPIGLSQTGDLQIVGGPAGVAYVVGQALGGAMFVRTDDGGATWSRPVPLATDAGGLRLAAVGQRVLAVGQTGQGTTVWRSEDGGATFDANNLGFFSPVMGIQAHADGAVWLYVQDMEPRLLESADGGVTFPTTIPLGSGTFVDSVAFGTKVLFGTSQEPRLMVASLSTPAMTSFVDGLSSAPQGPRSLVVDASDTVTVLDSAFDGLSARRLEPGATSFTAGRPLGPFQTATGVALSDKAVAVAMWQGGQVLVSVQVW
jgi:hypothetical protein